MEPIDDGCGAAGAQQRLTALFDKEAVGATATLGDFADPAAALAELQRILDAVRQRAVGTSAETTSALYAVETTRTALSVLDAVKVHQAQTWQAAQPPPRSRRAGRGRGLFQSDEREPPPPPAPVPPPRLLVNVDRMLDMARSALETADRLRAATAPPPPEIVVRPWAEDDALVGLLHDLLAAARRTTPEFLRMRIEQLTEELELEHEIAAVEFDGSNRELFDVIPSTNPADREFRTVRPALRYRGELLRAGEAREPVAVARLRTEGEQ